MPRRPYLSSAAVIPDHLRCNRTDGRRWRCPLPSLPNLRLCSHHHRPVPAAAKPLARQTAPPLQHLRRHSSPAKPLSDDDHRRRKRTAARSSVVKTIPHHRRRSSTAEEKPLLDHLRCKRTDGRGWRCHRRRQIHVSFCPHHYKLYQKNNSKINHTDSLALRDDLVLSLIKRRRRRRRREEMEELVRVAVRRRLEIREEREWRRRRRKEEEVTVQLPNGIMVIASLSPPLSPPEVGCFRNVGSKIDRKVEFDGGSSLRRCFRSKNVEPAPVVSKKVETFECFSSAICDC